MIESEVFSVLTVYMGRKPQDKDEARAGLKAMIKGSPGWLFALPESLLEKLEIKFDHIFDIKDIDLARTIGGKCEKRIID